MRSGRISQTEDPLVKTRVIILHSSDDLYGADRVLLQVAVGMQRAGLEPLVVLPDDTSSRGLLFQELTRSGIRAFHLPIAVMRRRYLQPLGLVALIIRLIRGTIAIKRILKSNHGPVVMYGFTFAVIAAPVAARVLRIPLLLHCHEILNRPVLLRKIMHAINVRGAQKVLCVSHAARNNIIRDEPGRADRVEVIYNGLEPDSAGAQDRGWARAELGVSGREPVVGMIGRVSARKGQDLFLRAAAILKRRGSKFHGVVIGGVFDAEQVHMDRLLQLRSELGMDSCFQVVDFRKDARALMSAFDILVCPSTLPESFAMVVLEAMDKSIPVIAASHGGPTEIVMDGVTGLLCEPNNAESLADAIEMLLLNPERGFEMGRAGKRRVVSTFSLEAQIAAINRAALEVAGERVGGWCYVSS
jgi:glycosyltransferase involved in cell wall biosynthesis